MKPDTLFLTLVWTLPIFTTLVALFVPKGRDQAVRVIHALGGALSLALSVVLTFRLYPVLMAEGQTGALHHVVKLPWFPEWGIQFFVGVDGLSMLMVLLTSVIVFTGILASWKVETRVKSFFTLLQLLAVGVYGVFISFDLFTFFFFYEMEAVAMFLLIGVWGSGRREYGAMKLTLMLMFGSALVLIGILAVHVSAGAQTFDLLELAKVHFDPGLQKWVFPLLFVGFAVSAALFPFHTWSPDGHSAAPTAVSMLAAGVMMKLGAYGCLRVAMVLMPEGARAWMIVLMVLVTFNVVLGAFIAIRHRDLKFITAYSSISHLGLVLLGLMAGTFLSVKGASLQMISHGFLTGLFFATIGMIYQRTHTRMLDDMGGLMKAIPFLGVAFVLAGFAGLGLPGFSGFVAELTVFLGVAQNKEPFARVLAILSILGITTTAVYVIRTANFMLGGPFRLVHRDAQGHEHVVTDAKASGLTDADPIEKMALVLLIGCLLAMGLFPGWIMKMLDTTLVPLMAAMAK